MKNNKKTKMQKWKEKFYQQRYNLTDEQLEEAIKNYILALEIRRPGNTTTLMVTETKCPNTKNTID